MASHRRWRSAPAALAVLTFTLGLAAWAYILPASSVLRRMMDVRDEQQLTSLRIDGTLSFTGEASRQAATTLHLPEGNEVLADATLWLRVPGRCRWDVTPLEGAKLSAIQSLAKRRAEGGELNGLAVALEHLCPLLASRASAGAEGKAGLDRYMASLKLGERTTSLARFGGQVAYVIGNPADGNPQLWIYKETFLPARVRIPDPAGGAEWDVRFLDYASPVTSQWFPRIVEIRRGAEPVLKFTALKADPRVRIDDRMF
jgi:hypothetical protein